MSRLTTVHGTFAARVLVARLEDEGIDAQLRGPVDSPYRFTVGDLARVDVYVPDDQAEDAAYVLLVNDVEDATTLPEPRFGPRWRWPALALVVALVVAAVSPVVRYLGA
ncbi:MAG: hypothetical protein ACXVJ7_10560 [Acidimicrobiia bacterium]